MEKKSILHIRDSSGIFGSERVILTLVKNINKDIFDISLLCMNRNEDKNKPLISTAQSLGVPIVTVDVTGRIDLIAIKKIRAIIRSKKINLIHTHDFKSDFYGFLATINLNVVRIATAHGSTRDSLMKRLYLFFDEWFTYRFFDRVISVSYNLSSNLEKKRLGKNKIVVIQNGLDFGLLNPLNSTIEDPLPVSKNKTVFAVIGRLFPDKGHVYFLDAFSKIHKQYPDIIGLIIGEGPERKHIETKLKEMGLSNIVHLCGVRNDMGYVYQNIDCLVIPSLTEGLPYVLLEAMAAGIPVLSTPVGDIPLLVHDGETGYLIPPQDSLTLSKRMQEVIDHPDYLNEMALKGKRLVEDCYSAHRMVQQTENLYLSLIS